MIEKIKEYSGGLPVIITGDFNEYIHNSGLQTLLNNTEAPFQGLWDISNDGMPDNLYSHNGWDPDHIYHTESESRRIDHILINSLTEPTIPAASNCLIYNSLWQGRIMSDHWAVGGNVTF